MLLTNVGLPKLVAKTPEEYVSIAAALAKDRPRLAEAGQSPEEQERLQRSDFLAAVSHQGEVAVFYSTRHAHGTALAAAGVSEAVIAKSMHHANRTTTVRSAPRP